MQKPKSISRRDFLKTAAVATAGAAVLPGISVAASPAAMPQAAQSEVVILTSGWPLRTMPTAEDIEADKALEGYAAGMQAWLDENPGVTFQAIEVNIWDQQAVVTAISGGTAPTYVFPTSIGGWSNAGARNAFTQGLMADVTPAIEQYGLIDKLTEGARGGWEPIANVGGSYMSYPIDSGMDMMWYRRDLLTAAGMEDPPLDWTWDDVIEVAKALTSEAEGRKGLGSLVWMPGAMLADHGFDLMRLLPAPQNSWHWMQDTSDPKWAEVLAKYRQLAFEDNAVYSDVSYTNDNLNAAFNSGVIGMRRQNILTAFGRITQEDSLAALANNLGIPYEEAFGFRPVPRGDNGYFSNPLYVGGVAISPDTSSEVMIKALGAVDFMFLGQGWDIQKAGQYAATQDLTAVFNYPLPIDGKYTYEGVPGTFEAAWGQRTKDDILAAAALPKYPDMALFMPVEQNPGPDSQSFDDAWSTISFVSEGVDPADVLRNAQATWNAQAAGFSSSISAEEFTNAARSYYEAVDAFWQEASPEFYENTFKPWYEGKLLPALG